MNRRCLFSLFLVPALSCAAEAARADCGDLTNDVYVDMLYHTQAAMLAAKTPQPQHEYLALFSRELRKLMLAPRQLPADAPDGPVLNALFGWGVLPGTEVIVEKVTRISGTETGTAHIAVDIKHHDKTHRVVVRLVWEDEASQTQANGWKIDDIAYDTGKTLTDYYKDMTTAQCGRNPTARIAVDANRARRNPPRSERPLHAGGRRFNLRC